MTAPVYATYLTAPTVVRAAQLTEESADDICRWTLGHRLTPERWVVQEGCWRVSAQRWYHPTSGGTWALHFRPAEMLRVGLRTRKGEEIAYENDRIVQGVGGAFAIVNPDAFDDLYRPAVDTVETGR